MQDIITNMVNNRNRKAQVFWDKNIQISTLINRIDSWYWKTKKVKLNIECINIDSYDFKIGNLFDFILHTKLVNNCDFKHPIIIDHTWYIIDWRHRLVKAILEWKKFINWIQLIDNIY